MPLIIYDTELQLAVKRYGGFNINDLNTAGCTPAEIEAFSRRYAHDFSYEATIPEITKALNLPPHAVKKLLDSAKKRILKHLKESRGKETQYKFNVPIDQAQHFKRLVGERVDMLMQLPGKGQHTVNGVIRRVEEDSKDKKAYIYVGVKL